MDNIFSHIFLLAGIQGILLSILLFTRKANHTANVLLGFSVLALSIDLFDAVYLLDSFFYKFPIFFILSFTTTYLYAPVFYLYIKILSTGGKFKNKYYLHFFPFFTALAYFIPFLFLKSEEKIKFILRSMNNLSWEINILNDVKTVQGIIYTYLVFKAIKNYNRRVKDSFSNMDRINLNWFRNLIIAMVIIWGIFAAGKLINLFIYIRYETFIHVAFSIIIYSIGYIALKQPEIILQSDEKTSDEKLNDKKPPEQTITPSEDDQSERYKKSGLSESAANELHKALLNLMENEKPYLDREFTLGKLAEMLDASPHNLSEVINTKINQNFYDFVNKYRVEEFIKRLNDPGSVNYSILAIAYDSGFNSKSSFNTIFKKFTQMTPSQYREQTLNNKTTGEALKE